MVHGYILIKAGLGKALDVASEVAKISGIKKAHTVTGTFDVIAEFEVETTEELSSVVVEGIHKIEGVCETQTSICVSCK